MGALALMGAVTPSMALFTNGGFENGDFTGWDVKWGKTESGAWAAGAKWDSKVTWYGSLPGGVGDGMIAGMDPKHVGDGNQGPIYLHAGIVNWNYPDAVQPIFSTTTPPTIGGVANTKKALLNVRPNQSDDALLKAGWDVTQISQTGQVTTADKLQPNGKYSAFIYWGAVLTDPADDFGHAKPGDQPFVHIKIEARKTATAIPYNSFEEFYTTDMKASGGWAQVPGRSVEYYKELINKLENLDVGDFVTVTISIGDCGQGGHGGYIYVDHAGSYEPGTIVVPPVVANPCMFGQNFVEIGNNSTINSGIGSKGPIQVQMGTKVNGDLLTTGTALYQNWQKPLALYNNVLVTGAAKTANATYYKDASASVTGGITTAWTQSFLPLTTQTVTVLSTITSVNQGQTVTLVPGRYGKLYANGSSAKRATVKLSSGVYEFDIITSLYTDFILDVSAGPIKINVKTELGLNESTRMAKLNGSFTDLPSTEVFWYSNGRFSIGPNSSLKGQFLAPNSMDYDVIGTNSVVVGSVSAKSLKFSTGTKFTCQQP